MQNDLDSLKDLLSGDSTGYQLDTNQLLGVSCNFVREAIAAEVLGVIKSGVKD